MNAIAPDKQLLLHRLERALVNGGGTHSLKDVVDAAKRGEAQIWEHGNTIAVTEVYIHPRKTVLRLWLCAGDMHGATALLPDIEAFARTAGATRMEAYAREGWMRQAMKHGYDPVGVIYAKEI